MKRMERKRVLMLASVASMIDQFNMPNLRLLLEMGYEVHVACNYKEGNTCNVNRIRQMRRTLRQMRVVQHQWDCPRNPGSVCGCLKAYLQLWELTGRCRFAWMHCHSPVGGALARIVAHRRGIGVVYTAHGFHFYRGAPFWSWLLYYPAEKLLARWTDLLVTVNLDDYRLAKRRFRAGSVWRIPGAGVHTHLFDAFYPALREAKKKALCIRYQIPEQAYILLSVGELNKGKNHRMVIAALARLHRRDVYYLVCGQGKLREDLLRYAYRLGVGGYVRMPGFQEQMADIYGAADIFVFPSVREGMPVSLLEAMAAGLPCVVSDIRGNKELIGGCMECRNTGCIHQGDRMHRRVCIRAGGMRFRPGRVQELARAVSVLLKHDRLRSGCGRRNQGKVREYDTMAVQKRMNAIYATMNPED